MKKLFLIFVLLCASCTGKIHEETIKNAEKYCENKECDRICRTEEFVDCLLQWLLNNYDLVAKNK